MAMGCLTLILRSVNGHFCGYGPVRNYGAPCVTNTEELPYWHAIGVSETSQSGPDKMMANSICVDAGLSDRNYSGNPACSCPEETGRSGQREQQQVVLDRPARA